MDEAIQVSCIIDKLPYFWKDFKHTLKHKKEELTLVELGSHLHIEESLRMQDSDKPKGNNVTGPLVVNIVEHNNSSKYNDHRGKRKHHDRKADPNKKSQVTCWKCGKPGHLKKNCKGGRVGNKDNGLRTNGSGDGYSNLLKGQNMFNKSFQVDLGKEFLSSRFSIKYMREADVILVSTPMNTSEKLMPNNGQAVSQLKYSRVIGCLMYAMTCTRPDIAFVMGKLTRCTSNPVLEYYIDASWISNTKDNSSTSGWVFLLGGGAS
uniref:Zinc finger, CCHC-type n=1 Tax=Tanacetum cinerariifolium TaxID=118510 RepID=A0A699H8L0_TANCI|nr:zinc finger, CCHC-type [Tanacetum cinerariifolium]